MNKINIFTHFELAKKMYLSGVFKAGAPPLFNGL
jgi:hypothetical protein